jgi:hypothetical protein
MGKTSTAVAIGAAFVAAFVLAEPARADPGSDLTGADIAFARGLSDDGTLFNFNLERHEGQTACDEMADGASGETAVETLMKNGLYSHDVAWSIVMNAWLYFCSKNSFFPHPGSNY